MNLQTLFRAYPWDLETEGPAAFTRLAGEIGVSGIGVCAATSAVDQLRPRATDSSPRFRTPGGVQFQPDARKYAGTRVRPIAAAWMKSRNPMEHVAAGAEKERLLLRASISCSGGNAMIDRFPFAATINAFGDASPERMCLSNPDVREYLVSLAHDLSDNYPVAGIELEDALPPHDHRMGEPIRSNPLWDWCFCASCRARAADAGLDVTGVSEEIQTILLDALRLKTDRQNWARAIDSAPELAAFQRFRSDAVASLARTIHTRTNCPLALHTNGSVDDLSQMSSLLSDGDTLVYRPNSLPAELPTTTRTIEYIIESRPPTVQDGPALVAAVHRFAQAGLTSLIFDDYGSTPDVALDWVRQAIRFARREAQ